MSVIRHFKNIRVVVWTLSMMFVGFALGQKGHSIDLKNILFSSGSGALVGFIIGMVIEKLHLKDR
ncbi:hypothetical protein [Rheinheimera sp. MM224]|uniref:hypothetical protein n=1 Tax=Rheinheimera sp. MM224 TaxID=3019969 RepID=UPI0021F8C89B|nr:hypothetical protein [Rheinheimera sp. MM224]CAI3805580.1 hypothetical protein JAMGFMIE_03908 [Rheinheimera sp. MM224]